MTKITGSPLKLNFNNLELAYAGKSQSELQNAYFIFRLMNEPFLVSMLSKLTLSALMLHLPVKWQIKQTIFRQFCGGESLEECSAIIKKMGQFNISTTLDYAVESKNKERDFERTKEEILRQINFAKTHTDVKSVSLKPTGIARYYLLEKVSNDEKLTQREQKEYENIKLRLGNICESATNANMHFYIDAEESPTQNAIDELSKEMMKKYNTDKPTVFITLQMYRWDRLHFLEELIETTKDKNIILGIKLVRGAYWKKEVDRATSNGIKPLVYKEKKETDNAFNEAIKFCLENIDRVALCAATHNEESSMFLASTMKKFSIREDHPHIQFSQLYGMSDHISYNLANAGYNVIKYLPYGPVRLVIPYLIRRAEENTGIEGQMGRELGLIIEEKKRRRSV